MAACENTQLVDAFQAADKALYKAKRDGGDVEAALLKRARAFRKINPAYAIPKELFRAEAAVTTNVEAGRASAHTAVDQVFDGLQTGNASSFERLAQRKEDKKQKKIQKRDEDLQHALFGSSDAGDVEQDSDEHGVEPANLTGASSSGEPVAGVTPAEAEVVTPAEAEVLYRPGAAAVETGPGLLGPPWPLESGLPPSIPFMD